MLLYVGEPHYKVVTVQEGCGDNLLPEDIKDGFVDYWLSSTYEQDGEEMKLIDSGQILTSKPIADMDEEEALQRIFDYWELGDPNDRDTDYTILEH